MSGGLWVVSANALKETLAQSYPCAFYETFALVTHHPQLTTHNSNVRR